MKRTVWRRDASSDGNEIALLKERRINPRRIAAEVKAGSCACEIRNPQGTCCLGNVNAAGNKAMKMLAGQTSGALT